MTRLGHRVRNLEYRLAPPNVALSWNDCFARIDQLAQERLSASERSLFQDAFRIRVERGEEAFGDRQREIWGRWNNAFETVQSGLQLPFAVEVADRWL